MEPRKYSVFDVDTQQTIAKDMELDVALMLVEAYFHKFWKEDLSLTIVKQEDKGGLMQDGF